MPKFSNAQAGMIDPKIIIGVIVVLVAVFLLASGSLKFSASIKNTPSQSAPEDIKTEQPKQVEQSTPKPTPQPTDKPKSYQNEKYGFELEYPSGWSLKENPSESFVAGFFSPEESNSDNYLENLLIRVVDISKLPKMTLQEAADLWENDTKKAEKDDFTVTDRKTSTIAGEEAKDIIFDIKMKDIDGHGMIRIVLKNKKAYIFQYNGLKVTYDKYLPDIETILDSVKF